MAINDGKNFVEYFGQNTWRNKSHQERVADFKNAYNAMYLPNFHIWTSMYARAYDHLALYCGDQLSPAEIEAKRKQRRSALTWNHVYRIINTIAGYFNQSQLGYSVLSVSPDDTSTIAADVLSDCLRRVCSQEGVYKKIASCVKDAAITGWSGLRAYVDDSPTGRGDIKVRQVSWNNIVIDPFFTQMDLSDCSYIAVRSLLPRAKLAAMFPDKAGMIMSVKANSAGDVKFPWAMESRGLGVFGQDSLNYTEMYRMVLRESPHLFNPDTKEAIPWDGDEDMMRVIKSAYPRVQVVNFPQNVIEFGILVEDQLVEFAENPYGVNCYPIQPFFAIFEPSYALDRKVNSLVSVIADPQRSFNKRKNALTDILDTSLQSGMLYKEGAVLNPESLYNVRAGQNICIDRDVPLNEAVQQITATDLPPSLFQAIRDGESDLNTLLGVNPEMFGQVQGGSTSEVEMSGVLYRMKQASALVGMQPFFSLIRESQELFGHVLLKMIQANYSPEKMAQISKKEITPELFNKDWLKFNIVVEEGLIENRNSNLEQKLALRQLGIPVSSRSIIEDAPVYGKASLIQFAEGVEQQQSQMQQIQMAKELQTMQNLAQSLQSEASKSQAAALSTLSEIGLKAAEKEEVLSRTQKIKAEAAGQFADVMKTFSELPPEKMAMALEFMKQMAVGIEQSVEDKKVMCEGEADLAIARRLPPQDLSSDEEILAGVDNPPVVPQPGIQQPGGGPGFNTPVAG